MPSEPSASAAASWPSGLVLLPSNVALKGWHLASVFICYRNDDALTEAMALERCLQERARCEVFRSNPLVLGGSVRDQLQEKVRSCEIFLIVIGRKWLGILEEKSSKGETDYVLMELREALSSGKYIIQVLVQSAELPKVLPEAVRALEGRAVERIQPEHSELDFAKLAGYALRMLHEPESRRLHELALRRLHELESSRLHELESRQRWRKQATKWASIVLPALLIAGLVLGLGSSRDRERVDLPKRDNTVGLLVPPEASVSHVWLRHGLKPVSRDPNGNFHFDAAPDESKLALVVRSQVEDIARLQYASAQRTKEGSYRLDPLSKGPFVDSWEEKRVTVALSCDPTKNVDGQVDCPAQARSLGQGAELVVPRNIKISYEVLLRPTLVGGAASRVGVTALVKKLDAAASVALVLGHNSTVAHQAIGECRGGSACQSGCGPLFVFSSATSLRDHFPDPRAPGCPWVFRMTPDNRLRAKKLKEDLPEIGGTNYRQLQIVYEDDSVEGDAGVPERGSYALDQVKYLKEVLPEYHFAYRVAFRLAQPGDPTQLEVRAGSLGQNEQDRQQPPRQHPPLAGHDFDFIVRHLRDRAQGETRVLVLVALYENILHFGKALLNADDGLSAWYVLGPRDVLEQTQDISFFKPSVQRGGRARLPLRTLTVGELNANAAGARPLKRAFVQKYKGETITSQVVQMYDALSLLDEAVGTTNKDLCPMVDCDQGKAQFDLEFYREELRHKIAAIQHTGAGGTTTFDQSGDSKGDVYWKGLRDGKMQGLDPLTSKD